MAWIDVIDEQQAEGKLRELYDEAGVNGCVANIYKIQSLNPPALEYHRRLYRTLMFGPSELTRAQREMIGVVVSTINRCHY